MKTIEYVKLNEVDAKDFIPLLNKKKVRTHLIDHQLFDLDTLNAWIAEKLEKDATKGCKVRAVLVDQHLAGWCGIQLEDEKYEIAIVIDDRYWGIGIKVFREMMGWAKALGHKTIFIHLLHTRPEYTFLRKISKNRYESELLGDRFTTYELEVDRV